MAERSRRTYRGVIDSITVPPSSAAPSFSAIVLPETDPDQVHQATGPRPAAGRQDTGRHRRPAAQRLRLIWIGQRQIPGIAVGTALKLEGMVSQIDGMPTIYNPRYEIISSQETNDA